MFTRSMVLEKGFRRAELESTTDTMSYKGTLHKSIFLFTLLFMSSSISWYIFQNKIDTALKLLIIGAFAGAVIGFITSIFPRISPLTAPIYTLLEGLTLGSISAYFESMIPGIILSAVLTTLAVCFVVLMFFKSHPEITHKLKNFIIIATLSIALLYIFDNLLGVFSLSVPYLNDIGPIGIIIDIFIIIIAAGNLLLDFGIIYEGVHNGAPKYMEWYASFGIMVTLVLMYTKILEVFLKLFGKELLEE